MMGTAMVKTLARAVLASMQLVSLVWVPRMVLWMAATATAKAVEAPEAEPAATMKATWEAAVGARVARSARVLKQW